MKLRENVRVTNGKTFPKCAKKHKKTILVEHFIKHFSFNSFQQ